MDFNAARLQKDSDIFFLLKSSSHPMAEFDIFAEKIFMQEFTDEKIQEYAEALTSPEPALLSELSKQTHLKTLMPQMLAGAYQGRLLAMISKMIRPKRVLEIGTFTGYSALCWAEGLAEGGSVITLDVDEELEPMIREFFSRSVYSGQIDFRLGDATKIIPSLNETFDIVFIDADKPNYSNYFDLVIDKVRPGGFIIADNVLWSGKVLEKEKEADATALADYSKKAHNDSRVETFLLPVRDGLLFAMKK